MLQKTAQYMKEHQMLLPGEKIVLGLSGGADSVCLLHILKDLGFALEAVHVNHGIRGAEADRDERFAKELCGRFGIPFHLYHFDVPDISRKGHLSEEEAGRKVRRQAFAEVMAKCGARHIALAHHGNDRAETFLFHLSRGTGIKGLSSMKPVDGSYIRPLLWAERRDIEAYVKEQGYAYVEDSTNASVCYTRNKLRHQIVPVFQEINQRSVAHICGAAEKLGAVSAYMDREAKKVFETAAVCSENEVQLSKTALHQADEVLRIPVLQKCLEYLGGSLVNITEEHFRMLLGLLDMQTGKELVLPSRMAAVRTYEGIRLFFREETHVPEPVKIGAPGMYFFGGSIFEVSLEDWDESKNFPINYYTKCFDYDKMGENVFFRTRRSGDYLEINRDHGRKSLQDYLVNEKVPKEKRDQVILLAEGSHILWVIGKRISEYYKVTKETRKILKIQKLGENEDELPR